MVSAGGFEPPISCVRGRHFGRAKLRAAENGPGGETRTRDLLLPRQAARLLAYTRWKLAPTKGIEPSCIRETGGGTPQNATWAVKMAWYARSDSNAHWMRPVGLRARGAGVAGARGRSRTRTGRHLGPLPPPVGISEPNGIDGNGRPCGCCPRFSGVRGRRLS